MCDLLNLNNICTGENVCIEKIMSEESICRRLLDIGLMEGTVIKCVGKSPMGSPIAFLIKGAVIAIRNSDCENIIVRRVEAEM